jgi:hypothetical protein
VNFMPLIEGANRIATLPLGESHVMILLDAITASGTVQYEFALAVLEAESGAPVFFVASEVNAMSGTFGGGSHFLGVFDGDGHANLGSSDDWADPSKFFPKARELAAARFGVPGLGR